MEQDFGKESANHEPKAQPKIGSAKKRVSFGNATICGEPAAEPAAAVDKHPRLAVISVKTGVKKEAASPDGSPPKKMGHRRSRHGGSFVDLTQKPVDNHALAEEARGNEPSPDDQHARVI